MKITALPNNFAMRKDVFFDIGGYREDLLHRPYPQGEDRLFKKAWCQWTRDTGNLGSEIRPTIFMFPKGYLFGNKHVNVNPFNLCHNLTRATRRNPKHKK